MVVLCWGEDQRILETRAVLHLVIFYFWVQISLIYHAEYPTITWSIAMHWPMVVLCWRENLWGRRERRRIWATRAVCGAGSHQSSASVSPGLKENVHKHLARFEGLRETVHKHHKEKWNCRMPFVVPSCQICQLHQLKTCPSHSSYKSIKRMCGGINLGQCSRPHMAETSALVTRTLV